MLLLKAFTLNKNKKKDLLESFRLPLETKITLTKLKVALGTCWPGSRLVVGPRCWPPGSRPQHLVPDRGKVVTAPIFVQGRLPHPDVDRLSNTSLEPSRFYCQYFNLVHVRLMFRIVYMYTDIVQPHFDYCISVWGNCPLIHLNKLKKLQNRVARIICKAF